MAQLLAAADMMEKVRDLPERRWYMEQTLANGWSRDVLSLAIGADDYRRQTGVAHDRLLAAWRAVAWRLRRR